MNSAMKKFHFFNSPIIFKYMDKKHTFSKHIHEESYMIGTAIKGKSIFTVENKKYEIDVGTICIIPQNVVHSCTPLEKNKPWSFCTFLPSLELLNNITNQIVLENTKFSFSKYFYKNKKLSNELQILIKNIINDERLYSDDIIDFINTLFDKYAIFDKEKVAFEDGKFDSLFKFLKDGNYCFKNMDFYKMAEKMDMNPFYFHRLFSKTVGLTPQTYINSLRIKKALKLLDKKAPLANIAQECGFYDQAYFTKQFKKYYGVTPNNYKEY